MSEERDPLECFHEEIRTLLGGTEVRLIKAPEGKGDAAFACFPLAKQEKKDPAAIATAGRKDNGQGEKMG